MILQTKIIAGLSGLLLLVAVFFYGYHKGSIAQEATQLTQVVKGIQRDDKIDTDVRSMSRSELDAANSHWMR